MKCLRWVWLLTEAAVTRPVLQAWKPWHITARLGMPFSLNLSGGGSVLASSSLQRQMPCAAGHGSCCLWESGGDGGASLVMKAPQPAVCSWSYSLSTSQKNYRDLGTQCVFSSLLSPTLNSWNILDLEMITSYPSLPVNVAVNSSLNSRKLSFICFP